MRLVIASLVGLLSALPLTAQEQVGTPAVQDSAGQEKRPREHVVKKGDTLWDLAGFYFQNPFQWPRIYQANTSVVEDPHWIYPKEVLVIPGLYDSVERAPVPAPAPATAVRRTERPLRTVFYTAPPVSTEQASKPTVLSEPGMEPPVTPAEFTSAPFVADPAGLEELGSVLRTKRQVNVGELRATAHVKDVLYVRYGPTSRPSVGDRLLVASVGDRVEGGRLILPTGIVEVLELDQDVYQAQLAAQFSPVEPDQLVIPRPMFPDFMGERPAAVEEGQGLEGHVVRFVDRQVLYGPADHGIIDLGAQDGVHVGDEFIAYVPERKSRSRRAGEYRFRTEQLPPETVALLRVVRVTDRTATIRVDEVLIPELENGIRVRRIRTMQ